MQNQIETINIDQLRQDCQRQIKIMDLIDEAVSRKRIAYCSPFYDIFSSELARRKEVAKYDAVISRLTNYLINLTRKEQAHA